MKKIFLVILKALGAIVAVVVFYLICGFLIPYIEVPEKKVTQPETVTAYILTNGVHTDLVVPVKSAEMDWSKEIPFENTLSQRNDFKYLSIGWGDKGFYLDTPTWAELKVSTAFNAAFWLSESAMHCTYYDRMTEGEDCKKLTLTHEQYLELIQFIRDKFDRDANGRPILIKTDAVYGKNDAFYDAKGRYSFLNTCNTWTNNGLKAAGQKAALWTPSDIGIFQHYKQGVLIQMVQ
ncbi:TIGR02117 family protein [Chryseobacterium sp.]|uniref:TIGR02117 family protein n=1 Tax=Chryseobacterium sp. TaxID=1871047 RepID=UPI0011C806E0|nr:TIGR02117 family protein [Chryseobacterium sp.]TXF77651.1 TIGR02117 family protein [Chryseobacterium sp.]